MKTDEQKEAERVIQQLKSKNQSIRRNPWEPKIKKENQSKFHILDLKTLEWSKSVLQGFHHRDDFAYHFD